MRGCLASVIAMAMIVPSTLLARSQEIPTLDVKPVCRGIAMQSADPGVGQGAQAETFRQCMESEQGVREELKKAWSSFSAADKRHCVELAKTGGESSNTELLTCLEMSRDVRALRSAAASAAKPAAPPSTAAAQPSPGEAASPPTPLKETPKTTAGATSTEAERAKAEAETAKASETSAQRKLADAEAALQRAKEEIGRANSEAERAKAAEQVAKQSEAEAKRKLADAEAARAAAERACTPATRPGLVGRLRGWLKRPSSKSP